jgi:hypothetical protein
VSGRLTPIKRDDFINRLKALGFEGPMQGTNHAFMLYGRKRQTIPSDHEYDVELLQRLLREVGEVMGRKVTRREWQELRSPRRKPRHG